MAAPLTDNRSGIHLTGRDSGWPVGNDSANYPEVDPGASQFIRYKSGDGYDNYGHANAFIDGLVHLNTNVEITVHGNGGTFTLEVDGEVTDPIPFPDDPVEDAAVIEAALDALPTVDDVTVRFYGWMDNTPQPWDPMFAIEFAGADANAEVPEPPLVADGTNLTSLPGQGGHYVAVGWEQGSPG